MRQTIKALLAGAMLAALLPAFAATDEHRRALQRQKDLLDRTPLSQEDAQVLQKMIDRGLMTVGDRATDLLSQRERNKGSRRLSRHPRPLPRQMQTRALKASKAAKSAKNERARKPARAAPQGRTHRNQPDTRTGPTNRARAPPPTQRTHNNHNDDWYDDYFEHPSDEYEYLDDKYYEDDYYTDDHQGDDYYIDDDYYYGKGKGKGKGKGAKKSKKTSKSSKSSKKGGKGKGKGGKGYYYDDDYPVVDDEYPVVDDDVIVGPPPLIPMSLIGFQEAAQVGITDVNLDLPDEFSAGTVYTYADEGVFGIIPTDPGYIVDTADLFALVNGKCTRTDPFDELSANYTGKAYCQFSYSFVDMSRNTEATLMAEGPVQIGDASILSVTGGTGLYRKTIGEIYLYPVDVSFSDPPTFDFNPNADIPTPYYMEALLWMEVDMIPPTVVY